MVFRGVTPAGLEAKHASIQGAVTGDFGAVIDKISMVAPDSGTSGRSKELRGISTRDGYCAPRILLIYIGTNYKGER